MPLTKESAALAKRKMDEASSLISRLQNKLAEGVGSRTEAEAIRQKIVSLGGSVSQDIMDNAVRATRISQGTMRRSNTLLGQSNAQLETGSASEYAPSKAVPETWEALAKDRFEIIKAEEDAIKAAQLQKEKDLKEMQRKDMLAKKKERAIEEKIEKMDPCFNLKSTAWANFGYQDKVVMQERNDHQRKAQLAKELKDAALQEQAQRKQQRQDYKRQGLYDPNALPHDRIDPTTGKALHTALPDKYIERMNHQMTQENTWDSGTLSRTETLQRAMLGSSQEPGETMVGSTSSTKAGLKHMTKVQAYQERARAEKEEIKNAAGIYKAQEQRNQELFNKANSANSLAKHDAVVAEVHAKKMQDEVEVRRRREGGMDLPTADEVAHSKKGAFAATKPVNYSPEDEHIPYNARGASYIDQFGIEDEERLRRDRKHVAPLTEEERKKLEKEFFYKRNPHKRPISPTTAMAIETAKAASSSVLSTVTSRSMTKRPNVTTLPASQNTEDFNRLNNEEKKINALPCYIKPLI